MILFFDSEPKHIHLV